MKILKSSERYFAMAGIIKLNEKLRTRFVALFNNFQCISSLGPALCGTSAAFVYYYCDEIGKAANSLMIFLAGFMCCGEYLFLKANENNIMYLIQTFQEIIDKGIFCCRYLKETSASAYIFYSLY